MSHAHCVNCICVELPLVVNKVLVRNNAANVTNNVTILDIIYTDSLYLYPYLDFSIASYYLQQLSSVLFPSNKQYKSLDCGRNATLKSEHSNCICHGKLLSWNDAVIST